MRHYLFIWLGIAACFAFVQIDHAMFAVLSLVASWLVALFLKPVVERDTFSSMYVIDTRVNVESVIEPSIKSI
jgi:membrane protein implicated in regulation of membrane protease activity